MKLLHLFMPGLSHQTLPKLESKCNEFFVPVTLRSCKQDSIYRNIRSHRESAGITTSRSEYTTRFFSYKLNIYTVECTFVYMNYNDKI